MKKQYIYKDPNNDIFYVNNKGKQFLLTEAVSPLGTGTYDIIIALEVNLDDDCMIGKAILHKDKYFFGASSLGDYLKGEDKFFLESCKQFLDDPEEEKKPEAFYTGGGIWLCAKYADDNHYYVIENDFNECLTYFDHNGEDQDTEFPCQNMVWSKNLDELSPAERKIHEELNKVLQEEMF